MTQSIYVVRSEIGPVKVGLSGQPKWRLSTLQVGSPTPLHLHFSAVVDEDASLDLEERAHAILAAHRKSGEWFGVSADEAVAAVLAAASELGITLTKPPEKEPKVRELKASSVTIRIEPELRAALERMARADVRTLSSLIEKILTEAARKTGPNRKETSK